MIVDLSCPIELRGYELLNDDFGNVRAYIRLFNLSDKRIRAYSATICWYNAITHARITENITVDECVIEPEASFKLLHSTLNRANIDHVEMYFGSVTFEDGKIWQPKDGELIDIGEQKQPEGAELDRLKDAAGEDAVQYPQIQKDYWRCVCGRVNLLTDEACARCKRDKLDVLKHLNHGAINSRAREDGYREIRRRETEIKNKKNGKLTLLKVLAVLLLIAVLVLIGFRFGMHGSLFGPTEEKKESQTDRGEYLYSPYSFSNFSGS